MTAFFPFDPDTLSIESKRAKELGASLAADYQAKTPYHYTSVDNFLPEEVITRVREEALQMGDKPAENMSANENLKTSFNPDRMPKYSKAVFHALNSRPFIQFLEQMSGIKGLIPDPYFRGAGLHEIRTGGHLSVHADFNHHVNMDLERRINLLIYLNDDWKDEYGGQLELWTTDMKSKEQSIVPLFNRAAMFSTTSFSNHGNPNPVAHPDGRSRKSIALYYYTATWSAEKRSHTTQFRVRPGSKDQNDTAVQWREFADDFMPPILRRSLSKLKRGS